MSEARSRMLAGLGLLLLRLGAGVHLAGLHGWDKLAHFGAKAGRFPDPLGIGSTASLTLVTLAEFFCSILVIVGLLTRLAAIPPLVTMSVAALVFHAGDPWATREPALMYLILFAVLLLCGPGRYSLDALLGQPASRGR